MVVADDPVIAITPYEPLPEMTFRAAAVVPPISVFVLNWILRPSLFARAIVPDGSVPMKLPSTKLVVIGDPAVEEKRIAAPEAKRFMTNPRTVQFEALI